MATCFYHDLEAVSPNLEFRLEAKSPDNGEIPDKNGQIYEKVSQGEQSNFRYQLISSEDVVIWERWQDNEGSPRELYLDDSGWSVVCLHNPILINQLIAIDPGGKVSILVTISSTRSGVREWVRSLLDSNEGIKIPLENFEWTDSHVHETSGGIYWSSNSISYFIHNESNRPEYFVIRTSWGRRLTLHLTGLRLLADEETIGLEKLFLDKEIKLCHQYLSYLTLSEPVVYDYFESNIECKAPLLIEAIGMVEVSSYLLGKHHQTSALRHLFRLEKHNKEIYRSVSEAFQYDDHVYCHNLWARAVIQQAIRSLGGTPTDTPAYRFRRDEEDLDCGQSIDRLENYKIVSRHLDGYEILTLLGIPNWIGSSCDPESEIVTEFWFFDARDEAGAWRTLTIAWEDQKIVSIEQSITELAEFLERPGLLHF